MHRPKYSTGEIETAVAACREAGSIRRGRALLRTRGQVCPSAGFLSAHVSADTSAKLSAALESIPAPAEDESIPIADLDSIQARYLRIADQARALGDPRLECQALAGASTIAQRRAAQEAEDADTIRLKRSDIESAAERCRAKLHSLLDRMIQENR